MHGLLRTLIPQQQRAPGAPGCLLLFAFAGLVCQHGTGAANTLRYLPFPAPRRLAFISPHLPLRLRPAGGP